MVNRISITIFAALFSVSLFAQKDAVLNYDVRQVTSKVVFEGHNNVYVLPRNVLRIEVEVKSLVQYKGPYSAFAEKYMNITDGVIQADNSYYSINTIKIQRLSIPDSTKVYTINYSIHEGAPLMQLNSDGVILGYNCMNELKGYNTLTGPIFNAEPEVDEYIFTDLGVISFVEEKAEKTSKMVQTDSVPVKVIVTQNKMVSTTPEYNANEAADFIRKLRKRRMKLVMGYADETFAVEGPAMSQMLKELDSYEQKYLELFVGKTIETTQTFFIDYEPEDGTAGEQKIMGWFSAQKGFSYSKPDLRRGDFEPLEVKSESFATLPEMQVQVMEQNQKNAAPVKHGLFYRIPGQLDVSIQFGSKTLYREKWPVAQKGKTVPLPVDYLNNSRYAIEFYPETGALKRIYQNNNQ